jgi:hypothetical protein
MSYTNIEETGLVRGDTVILINKNTKPNKYKHPAGKLEGSRRVWSGRWSVVKTLPIEQEQEQV